MYSYAALSLAGAVVMVAAGGAFYLAWTNGWATENPRLRWGIIAFTLLGNMAGLWLGWFGMFGPTRSSRTDAVLVVAALLVAAFSLVFAQLIISMGKRVPKE